MSWFVSFITLRYQCTSIDPITLTHFRVETLKINSYKVNIPWEVNKWGILICFIYCKGLEIWPVANHCVCFCIHQVYSYASNTTTSPHHSKANGKVESAVKSAKRMLRKTSKSGEDRYLALLNLRNVPSQGVETSPAQRLMGRRTRTLLSVTRSLLEPKGPPTKSETEQLELNQQRQAKYYNKSARDLQPLKQGDTVRMKPFQLGNKTWMKGKISQRLDERSYEATAGGATYRRNRQHIVKTRKPPEQQFNERSSGLTQNPDQAESDLPTPSVLHSSDPQSHPQPVQPPTRSEQGPELQAEVTRTGACFSKDPVTLFFFR